MSSGITLGGAADMTPGYPADMTPGSFGGSGVAGSNEITPGGPDSL